jgi:4-hydroxy-tetrahydrodipicolinate synthase
MAELKGTGVAIITPFTKSKSVDFDALGNLIEFLINGGVDYIVTLGTTGETPVLKKEEKRDVINYTVEKINNRLPVVVGIGGNDTSAVVDEINQLPIDAAVAILSASPYYNKPSQEGIYQHYELIAKVSPKPILLYNVPARTGRSMSVSTVLRLANEVSNIIGIKEASGDMIQCLDILRKKPSDFLVVSGDDDLALPQLAAGMDGVISVAANAFPIQFSQLVNLCLNQDFQSARKINNSITDAYRLMFEENNPAGIKAFLYEMGLIQNELRLPLVSVSSSLQERINQFVKNNML